MPRSQSGSENRPDRPWKKPGAASAPGRPWKKPEAASAPGRPWKKPGAVSAASDRPWKKPGAGPTRKPETGSVSGDAVSPAVPGSPAESPNLTKFLSTSGAASRRHAAGLVKTGHVSVNGAPCTDPSVRIAPGDRVTLDGRAVVPPREHVYVMLHKPRGYVCTADDPHAPKKALDLIDIPGVRLVSAGRLDKNSEGLILFSNDGAWIERLTHPRHGTRKTYQVTTEKPLSSADIRLLTTSGVPDDGETLRALSIRAEAPGRYIFILGEGKNREIRRMLESLGNRTRRLKRIAVGALRLGGLPMGRWRRLSPAEALLALGNARDAD